MQNEHLKQYKYLIALTFSNASDYIGGYFHIFLIKIRKIWKKKNLKLIFFSSEIALKLSKSPYHFYIFRKFSFLNRTLGLRKSFLNQTTYVLKNGL